MEKWFHPLVTWTPALVCKRWGVHYPWDWQKIEEDLYLAAYGTVHNPSTPLGQNFGVTWKLPNEVGGLNFFKCSTLPSSQTVFFVCYNESVNKRLVRVLYSKLFPIICVDCTAFFFCLLEPIVYMPIRLSIFERWASTSSLFIHHFTSPIQYV